jgi:hypothetical protein
MLTVKIHLCSVKIISLLNPTKMKSLKVLLFVIMLFVVNSLNAQVSVNVNIGSPPMWGPVGYSEVQYYYLPDVYSYYDVHSSMFIYQSGGVWVHRKYLPSRYRNYDLYGGYKVVLTDYHGNKPYSHYYDHKRQYAKGYHGGPQKSIGEKPQKGNPHNNPGHNEGKDNNHGHDKKK